MQSSHFVPLGQLPLGQLPWGQLPRGQLPPRIITPIGQLPLCQLPPRTTTPIGQLLLLVGQLVAPRVVVPGVVVLGVVVPGVVVLSPSHTYGAVGPPGGPVLYVGRPRVIPHPGKADRGGKHAVVTLPEGKQLAAGGQVVWLGVVAQNMPAWTQFVQVRLVTTEVTSEIISITM